MGRREEEPIERRHVFLFEGDYEFLDTVYGKKLGVSKVIRTLVRRLRRRIEDQAALQEKPPVTLEEVEAIVDATPIE